MDNTMNAQYTYIGHCESCGDKLYRYPNGSIGDSQGLTYCDHGSIAGKKHVNQRKEESETRVGNHREAIQ